MNTEQNYLEINRQSWNNRTDAHLQSDFYDMPGFLKGNTSLKEIELALLPDIKDKKVLHLQCHFGQDTLSLARMGAICTGVDLSDKAIENARHIASEIGQNATFICSDVYDLPNQLDEKFDVVFTSYGTIGWLPDIQQWAKVVSHFLKPGGRFIFAEFHPVVWMFDDDFHTVKYNYFNAGAIIETESGTYADREADIRQQYICWNHGLAEVVNSLIQQDLQIDHLQEYDYSPYNCLKGMIEFEPGKFLISHMENKIPLVYSISATKK